MRRPPVRIPRIVRWLMVLLALGAGWCVGDLLDSHAAAREAAPVGRPPAGPASAPASGPTVPVPVAE